MGWVLVVVAGWLVAGLLVGLVVGGVVRNRDRQVPLAVLDDSDLPRPRRPMPAEEHAPDNADTRGPGAG